MACRLSTRTPAILALMIAVLVGLATAQGTGGEEEIEYGSVDMIPCRPTALEGSFVHRDQVCDGFSQCSDGSDERACHLANCTSKGRILCSEGRGCYTKQQECDGIANCGNEDDEHCTECGVNEFPCSDQKTCVSPTRLCDGTAQCEDQSDEDTALCEEWCIGNFTTCTSEWACIHIDKKCNSRMDCTDNSDEAESDCMNFDCDLHSYHAWKCPTSYECIRHVKRCDAKADCGDSTDEDGCETFDCTSDGRWQCPGLHVCVDPTVFCNDHDDCADGSDEVNCESFDCETIGYMKCPGNEKCVDPALRCDGVADCRDGSDETGCDDFDCSMVGRFKCNDTRLCIDGDKECNMQADCADLSDERQCEFFDCPPYYDDNLKTNVSGNVINETHPCNGKDECTFGEDEAKSVCDVFCQWRLPCLTSGECIPFESFCDGEFHCNDTSDEWQCNVTGACNVPLTTALGQALEAQVNISSGWVKMDPLGPYDIKFFSFAWATRELNERQWVIVDIGEIVQLSGFLTRGVGVAWTSIFKMGYGLNVSDVALVQEDGEDKLYIVPGNGLKGARFDFPEPVRIRVVKFLPLSWYYVVAMRVEFMGCRITGRDHRHIPDDVICGEGWGFYKWGCYKRIIVPLPWGRAEEYCNALKGRMVSVHTQEEHDFLYARARTGWLGLKLPEHVSPTEFWEQQPPEVLATMQWRDGSSVRPFFPWHPNDTAHEHARCVAIAPPGYWILRDCDSPARPFICKRGINPWIEKVLRLVNNTPEHVQHPELPVYNHQYNYDFKRFWGMSMIDMDACRSCGHDADDCEHTINCGTEDSEICGVIRSPKYPLSFPVDALCTVQINGPRKSYIVLQFLDVDLPVEADGSCGDRAVILRDQIYPGGPWQDGARICSPKDIRRPYFSNFNSMQVRALSNQTGARYRGYLAVYNITYYSNKHLPLVYRPNEVYQCPCEYDLYEDRCYGIFTHHTHLSWTSARLECEAKNGTLASMSDGLETEFLHTALIHIVLSRQLGGQKMYIGLQDRNEMEYNMTWSDGHPMSYTAWSHIDKKYNLTQPSGAEIEDCIVLWYEYTWRIAQWHDTLCAGEDVFSYVCEIDADKEEHVCQLGMQDYSIENDQVIASWYDNANMMSKHARLDACSAFHGRGWSGIFDPKGAYLPWLQVDLPRLMLVSGIVTQGLCVHDVDARVTEFQLYHGMSEMDWVPYTGRGTEPVMLIGNDYSNITSTNLFDPVFTTLHIRLEIHNGTELFGLRFDLLGYAIRNLTEEDYRMAELLRRTDYAIKDDAIDRSQECLDTHFRCGDGSCVHEVYLCDGINDCRDGADESEEVCGPPGTCPEFSYSCKEGGGGQCISFSFFCDRDDHCNNYEDEIDCEWPAQNCRTDLGEKECQNKKCYDGSLRCNGHFDCADDSDENQCEYCQGFQCFDGSCLPGEYECDGQIDCNGYIGEDEDHCEYSWENTTDIGYCEDFILCRNGACARNDTNSTCLFNLDVRGAHVGCRDATHLEGCTQQNMVCPINTVQCDSGYCIQQRMVCDGKNDCIHGEDELNCDNYTCPGAHRCRGETNCVPKNQLCDGVPHCALGDDESFCSAVCPEGCECYGLVFFCRDMEFNLMLVDLPWYLRKIDLSNSFFAELEEMRGSNWTDVTFQRFSYVAELVLRNVGLWTLTNEIFLKLKNLLVLDLSYNMLTSVENEPFSDLERLRILNLRGNRIKQIAAGVFAPLMSLNELQIQENQLSVYNRSLFSGLQTVTILHTDSYQLICIAEKEANLKLRESTPPRDPISDCEDLIRDNEMRTVMWVLGWFAVLGNILYIVRRLVKQRGALTKIKVLDLTFLNLHIADAIMGVYCIIIASADEHYRGRYIENAEIWKHGSICQFAGFLFTLAAEIPMLALPIATIEESIYSFYELKFRKEFGDKEKPRMPQWITTKMTAIILGVSWLVLAFLAIVPLFGIPYFANKFYAKSTVCLPVYIAGDLPVAFGYSAFIFIIFNFACSLVMAACYAFMFWIDTQRDVEYDDEGEAIEEMAFSHRLFAVTFTNLACWLPVALFGMVGWDGNPMSVDMTPWIAMIMIPINAAVNPLIYIIFPDKKRDLGPVVDQGKAGKPGAKPGAKPAQGGGKGKGGGAANPKGEKGQAGGKGKGAGADAGKDKAAAAKPGGKGQEIVKDGEEGVKGDAKDGKGGPKDAAKDGGGKAQGKGAAAGAGKSDEGASTGDAKVALDNPVYTADEEEPVYAAIEEKDNVYVNVGSTVVEAEIAPRKDQGDNVSDDSGVSGSKGDSEGGSHGDDSSSQVSAEGKPEGKGAKDEPKASGTKDVGKDATIGSKSEEGDAKDEKVEGPYDKVPDEDNSTGVNEKPKEKEGGSTTGTASTAEAEGKTKGDDKGKSNGGKADDASKTP